MPAAGDSRGLFYCRVPNPGEYTGVVKNALLFALFTAALFAADWKPLFNGKNLDGWEIIGDGQWTVLSDGTLVGQRTGDLRKLLPPGGAFTTPQQFRGWVDTQSWLYTRRNDFGEFDLHVEYWTKSSGNSGVSIRDSSRAKWGVITPPDYTKTPSKIGYEIQINNRYPDPHPPAASTASWTRPKMRNATMTGTPWTFSRATTKSPSSSMAAWSPSMPAIPNGRRPGPSACSCTINSRSSCSAISAYRRSAK